MKPLPRADVEEVLARVGPLWRDLAGARLLLTGCTGFFGAWLLESLLAAEDAQGLGLEAWVLTRRPEAFGTRFPHLAGHPALRLLAGDVRTFATAGVPFTHVVHGAASSTWGSGPEEADLLREIVLGGTARVLEEARRAGAGSFLFISSGAVYGAQPPDLEGFGEDHPGSGPFAPYGLIKREAEALCPTAAIARCFAFLAPHLPLDAHFAAGNFLADAHAGRTIRVAGDGRAIRSYLYGTDLAVWLWTLLLRGRPGRAYNVGSDQAVTIEALARSVAAPGGLPVSLGRPPGEGPAHRFVPSILRARRELGLTPRVDLAEAIRRTLAWLST